VNDVSIAMWREMAMARCITMLIKKIKDNDIKLEPEEKKLITQAMLGP
jgi:hypothetical protein